MKDETPIIPITDDPDRRCGVGLLSTSKKDPFTDACGDHDDSYTVLGGGGEGDFRNANYTFWVNMVQVVNSSPWYKTIYRLPKAVVYRGLVNVFGRRIWYAHKKGEWLDKQIALGIDRELLEFDRLEKEGASVETPSVMI